MAIRIDLFGGNHAIDDKGLDFLLQYSKSEINAFQTEYKERDQQLLGAGRR